MSRPPWAAVWEGDDLHPDQIAARITARRKPFCEGATGPEFTLAPVAPLALPDHNLKGPPARESLPGAGGPAPLFGERPMEREQVTAAELLATPVPTAQPEPESPASVIVVAEHPPADQRKPGQPPDVAIASPLGPVVLESPSAEPEPTLLMEIGERIMIVGESLADPAAPETARQWLKRHRVWLAIIAVLTFLIFVV